MSRNYPLARWSLTSDQLQLSVWTREVPEGEGGGYFVFTWPRETYAWELKELVEGVTSDQRWGRGGKRSSYHLIARGSMPPGDEVGEAWELLAAEMLFCEAKRRFGEIREWIPYGSSGEPELMAGEGSDALHPTTSASGEPEDAAFDALLEASSLGSPRVLKALADMTDDDRAALAQGLARYAASRELPPVDSAVPSAHIRTAFHLRQGPGMNNGEHAVLDQPLHSGRLRREEGDALCKPQQKFWGLHPSTNISTVTCGRCRMMAERYGITLRVPYTSEEKS